MRKVAQAAWPALVLAAVALTDVGAQAPRPVGGIAWIDVHVHLVTARGRPGQDYEGAVTAALAVMDQKNIRKMVLMPPPQVHGAPPPYDYDAFIAALKRHPTRLAFLGGGGALNPILQDAANEPTIGEQLRRRFEQKALEILHQGAAGFGEISAHHLSLLSGHPYESVAADHPLLLLLADISARHGVVVDVHFDVVAEEMRAPEWLQSPPNPSLLRPNLAAFERLLEHNRKAKIVWAHAGSDMLGPWTVDLSRRLLGRHPNLYMSLRLEPGRAPQNHPLAPNGDLKVDWRRLLQDFPDRFVIGGDQFIASPSAQGRGPGFMFTQRAGAIRARTKTFLAGLPSDLARKIGYDNALRLYKLKE